MTNGEPMDVIFCAVQRDWSDEKFKYFVDCFQKALQVRSATIYNLTVATARENLEDEPKKEGFRIFFITDGIATRQSLLHERLSECGSANCAIADFSAVPISQGIIPADYFVIGFYEASQPEPQAVPNTLRFFIKMDEFIHHFRKANERNGVTEVTAAAQLHSNVVLDSPNNAFTGLQDSLVRDLRFHDYKVFISSNTGGNIGSTENGLIREAFSQAFLSVHFIPENLKSSALQAAQLKALHLATERLKHDGNFESIIWSPLSRNEPALVERLKDLDIINRPRTDFVQCPPETLKSIVLDRAERIRKTLAKPKQKGKTGFRKVYFIYDNADESLFNDHRKYYEEGEVEVLTIQGEANDRKKHQQYLVDCQAVVLYAEKASDMWLRMKLMDILKSPGWGRTYPIKPKALLKVSRKSLPPLPMQDFSVLEYEPENREQGARLVMGLLSVN